MNFVSTYPTQTSLSISLPGSLSHDLQQALAKESELRIVYQPQIDIATRRIVGLEALTRWSHPTQGEISPQQFIPIAEENNLIHILGMWILKQACAESSRWNNLSANNLTLTLNISPLQLESDAFCEVVKVILSQMQLKPKQLILKLTKINSISNLNRLIFVIKRLQSLGVAIALSDSCLNHSYLNYGYLNRSDLNRSDLNHSSLNPGRIIGYDSLDILQYLPIDLLKLRGEFVRQIFYNPEMEIRFYAIVNLAKRLNIPFIAEGIETVDQIEFLSWHGCRVLQGYWYAHPISAIELQPWLSHQS